MSQDYILKQLTSSLTYPESDTGRVYWDKIYKEVEKIAGTTNIPINTFNKIWIVPDKAEVYENKNIALITKASLNVMMEEDFLAMGHQKREDARPSPTEKQTKQINAAALKAFKTTILPKIAKDVNSGKNFATLRQIYHSLILGIWFKKKFKESLYSHYIDKGKIAGIDLKDKTIKDKIYNRYVEAFKKGVYSYIKTESSNLKAQNTKPIKRQYHSGGFMWNPVSSGITVSASTGQFMAMSSSSMLPTVVRGRTPPLSQIFSNDGNIHGINWSATPLTTEYEDGARASSALTRAEARVVNRLEELRKELGQTQKKRELRLRKESGIPQQSKSTRSSSAITVSDLLSAGILLGKAHTRRAIVKQDGSLFNKPAEMRWKEELGKDITPQEMDDELMAEIDDLLSQVDNPEQIIKILISVGGPTDGEKGIVGLDEVDLPYKTPYPLKEVLENRLFKKYSRHFIVEVKNDSPSGTTGEIIRGGLRNGMSVIMGTGNNKTVVLNGVIIANNGIFTEMSHNVIRWANGIWDFLGEETHGRFPKINFEAGDRDFEHLFGAPGIALTFVNEQFAFKILSQYAAETLPEKILNVKSLIDWVNTPDEDIKGQKEKEAIKAQAIDSVLFAVTAAAKAGKYEAIQSATATGFGIGEAFTSIFKHYPNAKWLNAEDFKVILTDGIGENFAKISDDPNTDPLLIGIRAGIIKSLTNQPGFDDEAKILKIANAFQRSILDWTRELSAATLTDEEKKGWIQQAALDEVNKKIVALVEKTRRLEASIKENRDLKKDLKENDAQKHKNKITRLTNEIEVLHKEISGLSPKALILDEERTLLKEALNKKSSSSLNDASTITRPYRDGGIRMEGIGAGIFTAPTSSPVKLTPFNGKFLGFSFHINNIRHMELEELGSRWGVQSEEKELSYLN